MKKIKIIDSTHIPTDYTKEMIGGVFDVRRIDYSNNRINVYNKDHSDWWYFSLSDVQEVCGDATFNGEPICVGDMVDGKEVYGWYVYDSEVRVLIGSKSNSFDYGENCISSHTPKYSKKIETITIGDKKYSKSEFEQAIKNLKVLG